MTQLKVTTPSVSFSVVEQSPVSFKVITPSIPFSVEQSTVSFKVNDAVLVYADSVPYEGSCEVIPKAYETQVLQTKGKAMKEDVLVLPVPYYETDNSNGTTIFIASEV